MRFRQLVIVMLSIGMMACSRSDTTLHEAIMLSREGLSDVEKSKTQEGLSVAEKQKLAHDGRGKVEKAKEIYRDLIEKEQTSGLYYNNYGWLQMKTGDFEGARKSFESANTYRASIEPNDALDNNIRMLNKQ
jgi:Tfp pilus assembly protein PilF